MPESKGLQVLLAVTSEGSVEPFARCLRDAGHAVDTADEASVALDAARVRQPDVIVLDLGLPGGRPDLTRDLCDQAACRRPFVIGLADISATRSVSGVDLLLPKPASVGCLLALLRRFQDVVADSRGFDPVI